jgi:hypothetical protein
MLRWELDGKIPYSHNGIWRTGAQQGLTMLKNDKKTTSDSVSELPFGLPNFAHQIWKSNGFNFHVSERLPMMLGRYAMS